MSLGYDGKLYILAFDHRGSFLKNMFGVEDVPEPGDIEMIEDSKRLIFEGMAKAVELGADPAAAGTLVDEQFGADIPRDAKSLGLKLAMPVEKSGQKEFDFEYGDAFGEHITKFDPDFSKVLVRLNPDADAETNERQLGRLKRLSDWLKEHNRKFLFELLVPAEPEQLESVDGDSERYDLELRPELMRRAIEQIQDAGVDVDIWKIEGVDTREECEMLARTTRRDGRDGVACVLLGRGADDETVDHWLRQAAPIDGFIGFAIGRSIWWDQVKYSIHKTLTHQQAVDQVAANYRRFIEVYEEAESGAHV